MIAVWSLWRIPARVLGRTMPSVPLTAERRTRLLPLLALSLIVAGGALQLAGLATAGDAVWAATVATMLVPLTVSIARTLAAGRVGVDAIAATTPAPRRRSAAKATTPGWRRS